MVELELDTVDQLEEEEEDLYEGNQGSGRLVTDDAENVNSGRTRVVCMLRYSYLVLVILTSPNY